jgi:ABC-2 type transport system permease protein
MSIAETQPSSASAASGLGLRPISASRLQTFWLFLRHVRILTGRNLLIMIRDGELIFPVILGIFFLLIYDASLSGAAAFFLAGQDYLGFILPLSVVSTALSASGTAGQALIRDMQEGYFDKLLLTPISRPALLFAPMLSSAIGLVVQTCAVIGTALLFGLRPVTGIAGLLVLLGFSMLIGLALAGFIVGIALRTGNAAATNSASFLVFPLSFLTSTFTPIDLLSGWIRTAAELNPITYLLDATRGLLNNGWDALALLRGIAALGFMCVITFTFAGVSLQARTSKR